MRKFSLYLIYIVVATIVCATLFSRCGQRVHNPLLLRAESLVIDNPDSALTLLEQVRPQIEEEDTLLYNLVWAEMYYMQTKTMEDSLLQSISKVDKSMGEEHFLIKELLHSIFLYRHDSIQAAHSRFLDCNSSMGDNFHPYWKCLVNDYIAVIFLNTGAYEQSKIHFDNVLKYAKMTGNERNVANAYIRQAIYYHHTNKLDSALHYAKLVLSNEDILDSMLLASAQHNLAMILMSKEKISPSHTDILDLLQSSLRYSNGKLDSLITYSVIAQVSYKRDSVDLAMHYQQQVECGDENIAKLILYRFLRDYYDAREMNDSAYKYMKLYDQMDFIYQRSKPVVEVQTNARQQALADAEKSFAEQKLGIITLALIGLVLVMLGWTLYHQRKMGKKTKQIELQDEKIKWQEEQISQQSVQIDELDGQNKQQAIDLEISQKRFKQFETQIEEIEKIAAETNRAKNEAETARHKAEAERNEAEIARSRAEAERDEAQAARRKAEAEWECNHKLMLQEKERVIKMQSQANRVNAKLARSKKKIISMAATQGQALLRDLLDKEVVMDRHLSKEQMEAIKDAYIQSGDCRKQFVDMLEHSIHAKLQLTNLILSILYNEHFCDADIKVKLEYEDSAFSTAKNRLKKVLEAGECTPVVLKLLSLINSAKNGK